MFNRFLSWLFGDTSGNQRSSSESKWGNITIEYKRGQEAIEALASFVNDTSDFRSMIDDEDVYFCPYTGKAEFSSYGDDKNALKARNWYAKRLSEMGLQVERFSNSYVRDGTKNRIYILDFQHPDWLQIRKESGLDAKREARQVASEEHYKRDMKAYEKRIAEDDGNVRGRYIHDKPAIDALRALLGEEMVLPRVNISTRIHKGDRKGSVNTHGGNNNDARQVRDFYAKLLKDKGYAVKLGSSSYVIDGNRNVTYSLDFRRE
jgi:hypothetical protein